MSECIGAGCLYPGCSGKNAGVVNDMFHALVQSPGLRPRSQVVPNRKERRKARRRK